MGNLIDIQHQIEKLQKQAADIRSKEFDATVQDIVAKMQAFGITLKDLQAVQRKGGRGAKAKAKPSRGKGRAAKVKAKRTSPGKGGTVAAKYRGPNGETWSGRGLMPRWLSGLVNAGRSKEEFAVQA
jgi:DNA-binding protein H-NS